MVFPSHDRGGPFEGFRRPTYPYFIGSSYHSEPISFNFQKTSNQDDYDLNGYLWLRNTTNYKFKGSNSSYDYIFDSNTIKEQNVEINVSKRSGISKIGILTGGNNYKVSDRILFDNSSTNGNFASAKVDKVFGKQVVTAGVSTNSIQSIEFQTLDGRGNVVAFTTSPHNLKNLEIISISGLSTEYSDLQGSYSIGS